ncbi:MAG: hypothetical protein J0L98_20265, partial [Zoogloea sp.]|nr:hypothetical protein [Zoogloea sp.]
MSDELNPAPLADLTEAAPPATPTAPTRSPRKKKSATPPAEAPAAASAADGTDAQPKPRRAPRKPRVKKTEAPSGEVTADLFALTEGSPEAAAEVVTEVAPEQASLATAPAVQALAEPAPVPQPESEPLAALVVAGEVSGLADVESDDVHADVTSSEGEGPSGPRRKRKRRRGKGDADREAARGEQIEMPGLADGVAGQPEAVPLAEARVDAVAPLDTDALAAADPMPEEPAATPEPLPPLTVVSLGLELPPVLSTAALERLRAARVILGTADALDRLAGLGLDAPQQLCAADSAHMDVRAAGHAGSVLVVVGDGAGDGPALELLADLGPAYVRVLPGVDRK